MRKTIERWRERAQRNDAVTTDQPAAAAALTAAAAAASARTASPADAAEHDAAIDNELFRLRQAAADHHADTEPAAFYRPPDVDLRIDG